MKPLLLGALLAVLTRYSGYCAEPSPLPSPEINTVTMPDRTGLVLGYNVAVVVSAPNLHLAAMPKVVTAPQPQYPPSLLNAGVVGKCEVEFELATDGTVRNVRCGRSTHDEFGKAAMNAVKQWKFEPLIYSSSARPITATARFSFSLFQE